MRYEQFIWFLNKSVILKLFLKVEFIKVNLHTLNFRGIKPVSPALEVKSLNHRSTGEVLEEFIPSDGGWYSTAPG